MEKVFDEVVYPEELTLKKWTMWPILSLTKVPTVLVTKRFNQKANYEEPIQVAREFDPQLKFVTFTVHRDPKYEDVDNNIHPPPPLKSAFEVLMTRQNPYNKVPVKFSEEAPRFTGHILQGKVFIKVQINCQSPTEWVYYASSIEKPDLCCYCAAEGIQQDNDLMKKYRVVLPLCQACLRDKKLILKRNPIKN